MSYHAMNNPIVWIDCEMTGLNIDIDELVEVSVVVTNSDLHPLDAGLDLLIRPSQKAVDNMGEFVRNMHTHSGLIHEWENGITLEEAQSRILTYIRSHVPDAHKAPLAGNSVATDKMFLERYMPEVIGHLHYRIIDVSSIKELAKRWYPRVYFSSPEKTGNHRALGDIYDSIDELRYYRDVLFPGNDGPTSELTHEAAQRAAGATASIIATSAPVVDSESSPVVDSEASGNFE